MITTGIVRRFDDLGRIHIPKEIRKKVFGKYNVEGTPMEIFYFNYGNIIIKLYKESNVNE